MRRHAQHSRNRRDAEFVARQVGFTDAGDGCQLSDCPYTNPQTATAWQIGWTSWQKAHARFPNDPTRLDAHPSR